MDSFACRDAEGGVILDIRVMPRGRRDEIAGVRDGRLCVRTTAAPVDGAANARVLGFVAALLDTKRSAVSIILGERSRDKTLYIDGLSALQVRERLGEVMDPSSR